MPHPFLNRLRVRALVDHERGASMPQVVEPRWQLDAELLGRGLERLVEREVTDEPSVPQRLEQAPVVGRPELGDVVLDLRDEEPRDADRPMGCLGLRLRDVGMSRSTFS